MREPTPKRPAVTAPLESKKKPTSRPTTPPRNSNYGSPASAPRYHVNKGTQDYVSPNKYADKSRTETIRQKDTVWIAPRKAASGRTLPGYLAYRNGPKKGARVSGTVKIEQPGTTYPAKRVQSGPGGTSHRTSVTVATYVNGRNSSPTAVAAAARGKDARVQKKMDSKPRIAKAAGRVQAREDRAVRSVAKKGRAAVRTSAQKMVKPAGSSVSKAAKASGSRYAAMAAAKKGR